ncbi:MAG TPA: type III PLP-dependent enzyme [Methylomirabilota bacterium]|nr:type III PLP-dependent enzyme [Methylomirabilota bacterium]
MDLSRDLVTRYFAASGSELCPGGVPIGRLVERYGTPLFVYDTEVMDRKWDLLRMTLPPEFSITYSVKANPNVDVLRHMLGKGAGLEVASGGEILRAISAGCAPSRILFAGPGKLEAELELALSHGIGEVHVESLLEAERIVRIARRLGTRGRTAIRVNPAGEAQGGAMRMGGKPAPFGIDEETIDPVLNLLVSEPAVEFRGLHLFSGTQILDHGVLAAQYRLGIEIARRVARRVGRPLATLDFGGGLGIPYFPTESELDMGKLREELESLVADIAGDPLLDGTQLLVEPGRYLVGEAGVYVARINDIKVSRGKTFYILDGGMNHHLAASGNLGQVIKRNFPITILNKLGAAVTQRVDVVGPLCTPLDTLGRDVMLPVAEVGDLIGVLQSGAYGLSASPVGFLSHPTPAEVMVGHGEARLVRPRGSWSELSPA